MPRYNLRIGVVGGIDGLFKKYKIVRSSVFDLSPSGHGIFPRSSRIIFAWAASGLGESWAMMPSPSEAS